MTRIDTSPYHLLELAKEECEILISILHQIDYNMESFLKTPHFLSSCAFFFDADRGKDELFRGLYRKIQEIEFNKKPEIPSAKQEVKE